jgi:elongation factor P
MINVTELRPGNYFEDEGALYQVLDILLNKTAMRKMVAKIKVKNLRTGAIFELARNSGYGVEEVRLDKKNMQYLYDAGETLCFMDGKTFEQIELPKANLQNEIPYLAPNGEVIIVSYNDEILGIPASGQGRLNRHRMRTGRQRRYHQQRDEGRGS